MKETSAELWLRFLPLGFDPSFFPVLLTKSGKELKSSTCNCQTEAKGSCRQTSHPAAGCLQVHAHIWPCLCPDITLRMTLKISSGLRGSFPDRCPQVPWVTLCVLPGILLNHPRIKRPRGPSQNMAEISTCLFYLFPVESPRL